MSLLIRLFFFIIVVSISRGASLLLDGVHFFKILGGMFVFALASIIFIVLRKFANRNVQKLTLCLFVLILSAAIIFNYSYYFYFLPNIERNTFSYFSIRRLPDNSLFSLMKNRGGNAPLIYAFLRKEASEKILFVHSGADIPNKETISLFSRVLDIREYNQNPDVFASSLGMEWESYKDPVCGIGFDYAKNNTIVILGRVGVLECK